MTLWNPLAALALASTALLHAPALAGPGHDHGHDHDAPAATGNALPRFAASSELFELVGVLDGRQLTLYLDRATDNAPISGAQIELEIGGTQFKPEARDEVYELTLPAAPQPGVLPVTATVTAGADIDLLAGELDIHGDTHADEAAHGKPAWGGWALGGIAALIAATALARLAWRGRLARHRARTGAPA